MNKEEIMNDASEEVVIERPSHIPEKFWDQQKQDVNVDGLLNSYAELERKISQTPQLSIPNHHGEYCITCKSDVFDNNPIVNERLHQAGFTQEQAQLVYDLAHEALEPLLAEILVTLNTINITEKLEEKFGGPERWQEISRQLSVWGKNKLPEHTFQAMVSSYEGVMALYDMMNKNEPSFQGQGQPMGLNSEEDVRKLMRDPKYWRDQDPGTVEKVREGFRRLYPD